MYIIYADNTELAESNLTNFGNLYFYGIESRHAIMNFSWQGRFLGIGTV